MSGPERAANERVASGSRAPESRPPGSRTPGAIRADHAFRHPFARTALAHIQPPLPNTRFALVILVGKVIAHCPKNMVIMPYHHAGMEGVIPQYATGQLKTALPMGPNTVTFRVGEEIQFGDLIDAHEKKYGKLWKYEATKREGEAWASSESDKILYSLITRRVEQKIKELERQSVEDADPLAKASREIIRRNLLTPQDGFKEGLDDKEEL